MPKKEKQYDKTLASIYKLLYNLQAGKAQSQWDCIVLDMHDRDLWAGVDRKSHDEKHPKSWESFKEQCLELHKLTVFPHNAAERQRC